MAGMIRVWGSADWKLTPSELSRTYQFFNRFMALTAGVGEMEVPKRHLAMHLVGAIHWFGNPRFYSTWKGESLNKVLKGCCRNVGQATFEPMVLSNMEAILRTDSSRRMVVAPS